MVNFRDLTYTFTHPWAHLSTRHINGFILVNILIGISTRMQSGVLAPTNGYLARRRGPKNPLGRVARSNQFDPPRRAARVPKRPQNRVSFREGGISHPESNFLCYSIILLHRNFGHDG